MQGNGHGPFHKEPGTLSLDAHVVSNNAPEEPEPQSGIFASLRSLGLRVWSFATGNFHQRSSAGESPTALRLRKRRRNFVLACLLVAILSAVVAFVVSYFKERHSFYETLTDYCSQQSNVLANNFEAELTQVGVLAETIRTFTVGMNPPVLTQEVYHTYVDAITFSLPALLYVGFAQLVSHADRATFEASNRLPIRNYLTNLTETEHATYAPLLLTQNLDVHLRGYDLFSLTPGDVSLRVKDSWQTSSTVFSPPLPPLSGSGNQLQIVLPVTNYSSSYSAFERSNPANPQLYEPTTTGFVMMSFDLSRVIQITQNLTESTGYSPHLLLAIADVTDPTTPLPLGGAPLGDPNFNRTNFGASVPLDLVTPGRNYELWCSYESTRFYPASSLGLFGVVLVVALVLVFLVWILVMRIQVVEADVTRVRALNTALKKAKRAAETADESKSKFLATMSHEIRTPMNGVLGMLGLLLDTDQTSLQREYTATALTSGKALVSLISDILDLSKIDSGHMDLESIPFDVSVEVDDTVSLFEFKAAEKGIQVAALVQLALPDRLIGDPSRFRQVLNNLLSNALKFTAEGHVLICVRMAEEEDHFHPRLPPTPTLPPLERSSTEFSGYSTPTPTPPPMSGILQTYSSLTSWMSKGQGQGQGNPEEGDLEMALASDRSSLQGPPSPLSVCSVRSFSFSADPGHPTRVSGKGSGPLPRPSLENLEEEESQPTRPPGKPTRSRPPPSFVRRSATNPLATHGESSEASANKYHLTGGTNPAPNPPPISVWDGEETEAKRRTHYRTYSGLEVADRGHELRKVRQWARKEDIPPNKSGTVRLLVSVEDTGCGIPVEAQGRIMQPFMQADSSTSRQYGGTGIGLSISRRLAELMGGGLSFTSQPGVGTCFRFDIELGVPGGGGGGGEGA